MCGVFRIVSAAARAEKFAQENVTIFFARCVPPSKKKQSNGRTIHYIVQLERRYPQKNATIVCCWCWVRPAHPQWYPTSRPIFRHTTQQPHTSTPRRILDQSPLSPIPLSRFMTSVGKSDTKSKLGIYHTRQLRLSIFLG